jgi:nitrogen fixation protein NifB
MSMDFGNHPCFNTDARHSTGRIHLPVAAKCNIQCNFCNRKYDCINESRPGVTSVVLSPHQAADYLDGVLRKIDNIAVVGIAGPGDPFANPEETLETLELVHERHPEKLLCLASNGLGISEHVEELSHLNISHVTITLNAIDPAIGAELYAWVRFGPKVYRGVEGARFLLSRQTEAVKLLKAAGITVKINTVVIPGINDGHAADVASYAACLGADIQNCIPMMHVEGAAFEGMPGPSPESMEAIRLEAGKHLAQMSHCARCRADAAGLLGADNTAEIGRLLEDAALVKPSAERPYIAAASMEGLFVNQHLGEASSLWIFALENGQAVLKEQRPAPVPGGGNLRWEQMARTLGDCCAVLAANCGPSPRKILEERGLRIIAVEGLIAETALPVLQGRQISRIYFARAGKCGAGVSCGGNGMGCGA